MEFNYYPIFDNLSEITIFLTHHGECDSSTYLGISLTAKFNFKLFYECRKKITVFNDLDKLLFQRCLNIEELYLVSECDAEIFQEYTHRKLTNIELISHTKKPWYNYVMFNEQYRNNLVHLSIDRSMVRFERYSFPNLTLLRIIIKIDEELFLKNLPKLKWLFLEKYSKDIDALITVENTPHLEYIHGDYFKILYTDSTCESGKHDSDGIRLIGCFPNLRTLEINYLKKIFIHNEIELTNIELNNAKYNNLSDWNMCEK